MKCALCGKEAKLMQSHIIPKFVYKRIKSSKNSRFRSLDNIKHVMQDGEKKQMLCHDCEELFSVYEKEFVSQYFDYYLKTGKITCKTSDMVEKYFLTVTWRVLWYDLYRLNSHINNHFFRNIFEAFCNDLGKYLLSMRDNNSYPPSKFKTYVYKLDSLIKNKDILEFSEGCIFGYSFYQAKYNLISVIVYYAGLVFVTYYNYDKRRFIIIGQKHCISPAFIKKRLITKELEHHFLEMAYQYEEVMTPELQKAIQDYYEKHM